MINKWEDLSQHDLGIQELKAQASRIAEKEHRCLQRPERTGTRRTLCYISLFEMIGICIVIVAIIQGIRNIMYGYGDRSCCDIEVANTFSLSIRRCIGALCYNFMPEAVSDWLDQISVFRNQQGHVL